MTPRERILALGCRPVKCAKHGSPADRGSSDAYYRREPDPHKYPNGRMRGVRVALTDPDEIAEYLHAYENEDDRKDYGPSW